MTADEEIQARMRDIRDAYHNGDNARVTPVAPAPVWAGYSSGYYGYGYPRTYGYRTWW